ncbi:hypothetical protein F4821DRAFT_262844 [Hypoxylon rubiginosum]|uniref:Uncharacterized protein n=1 Tax=Hypoxylon rubiginosum TaxID=110542 RepID=A0ACC0CTF4_9PEZI|nr:hypothetical protein F4821DRAFT_262844 [Hypoxylon rubiginosum]
MPGYECDGPYPGYFTEHHHTVSPWTELPPDLEPPLPDPVAVFSTYEAQFILTSCLAWMAVLFAVELLLRGRGFGLGDVTDARIITIQRFTYLVFVAHVYWLIAINLGLPFEGL